MLTVVYPGTFDPFTRGHEDLVRRAARLFDRVVVGIAASESKRPMFTLDERIEMAREVLADLPNATVTGFSSLLMAFLVDIDLLYIARIWKHFGGGDWLGVVIAVCTVAALSSGTGSGVSLVAVAVFLIGSGVV